MDWKIAVGLSNKTKKPFFVAAKSEITRKKQINKLQHLY